jgi:hypothetical protein
MKARCLVTITDTVVEYHRSDESSGVLPIAPGSSMEEIAATVEQLLQSSGCAGDDLILGISSADVFFLASPLDPIALQSEDALRFAVEEKIPIDAEAMIPLVIGNSPNHRVLAWQIGDNRELLTYLKDEYGISFSAFVPAELLIANSLLAQKEIAKTSTLASLRAESTEFISFADGELVAWSYVYGCEPGSQSAADMSWMLETDIDSSLLPEGAHSTLLERTRSQYLAKALCENQKSGRDRFNFTDRLDFEYAEKKSAWEPVLLATLFLFISLAGAFGYQSMQVSDQARKTEGAIIRNFLETFPGRKINGPVEKLIQEELKRQTRTNGLLSHANTSVQLLETLGRFLEGTPQQMRFQFDSLTLKPTSIVIVGQVANFEDFQTLKRGFVDQGFLVEPSSRFGKPFTMTLTLNSKKLVNNSRGEAVQQVSL